MTEAFAERGNRCCLSISQWESDARPEKSASIDHEIAKKSDGGGVSAVLLTRRKMLIIAEREARNERQRG
jgi:hypothetical protein